MVRRVHAAGGSRPQRPLDARGWVPVHYKKGTKFEAVRYRAGPELKALTAKLRWNQIPEGEGKIDLLAWEDEAA